MSDKVNTIFDDAKKVVNDNKRVQGLLVEVDKKLKQALADHGKLQELSDGLQLFVRMIGAHLNGSYKAFSTKTILFFVFGLVYFITPTDLIPDFLPVLGLMDDLSLIYYIIKSFSEDIEDFKTWENTPDQD